MGADTREGHARLLPARLRPAAAVLVVGCAVLFLVLAVRYHGSGSPGRFDSWIENALPRLGYPRRGLARTTDLGPVAFFVLDAIATVVLLLRRNWWSAALAVAGPALTMLVAEVAKPLVGRTNHGSLCLPSGHTAGVTTVTVVGAVLLVQRMRARPVLAAVLGFLAATVLATAMAVVLVLLGWHFATDTVAGYCAAVASTLGAAFALDWIAGRRSRSRPSRPAEGALTPMADRPE